MSAKPRTPPATTPASADEGPRTPLDWPRQAGQLDRVLAAIAVRKKRRRRHLLVTSGSVASLCFAGLLWLAWPDGSVGPDLPTPSPALVLLPQRQVLPDG